jgi:serine/threonine protein kinase
MGEVYRARDTRLDRTVAIKVLPQANSADERRLERFRQEARAVSRLTHPNICTLHDVGEQDGTFFLVMEHLSGRTLANRLEEGPLPAPELLRLGIQMAEALHAAHREGVVHRDLKPANVMLTREGAKLLDFGLARLRLAEQEPGLPSTVSHWARCPTWRRSSWRGGRRTRARTSSRWGWCSTRWPRAGGPSRGTAVPA